MKIAAVDYGTKRIGLAVSDDLGMFAHPAGVVEVEGLKNQAGEVARRFGEAGVGRVLVGLPKNMDGTQGPSDAAARAFAEALRAAFSAEIVLVDERLSTVEASRRMQEGGLSARKQKQRVDAAAAVVILQGYLDVQPPPP
jgi:putative holliday junction resolvase